MGCAFFWTYVAYVSIQSQITSLTFALQKPRNGEILEGKLVGGQAEGFQERSESVELRAQPLLEQTTPALSLHEETNGLCRCCRSCLSLVFVSLYIIVLLGCLLIQIVFLIFNGSYSNNWKKKTKQQIKYIILLKCLCFKGNGRKDT